MDDRVRTNGSPELSLLEFAPSGARDGWWLEGPSEALGRLKRRASAIASTGCIAAVLVGEPGCGKHRLARWLHRCGARGERPLASIDAASPEAEAAIAALVSGLLAGTAHARPGNLIVHNVQRASLGVIRRLLELLSRQDDCGLFLLSTAPAGALRARTLEHEQLIGRSTSALLEVPALRDRADDIATLSRTFLTDAAAHYDRPVRGLSPQAIARLERHTFPGNLRELRLIVEHAVLRGTGDWITLDDLGLPNEDATASTDRAELRIRLPGASLREIELQALRLALRLADGRLVRAAELLGITRHALRRKLEKYNLDGLRQRPGTPAQPQELDRDAYI